MSAFAQQQSIAFRANVVAKSVSSKKQSKKIQRCSLRVEAAKKSVGDLSKSDLEGTLNNAYAVAFFVFSSLFLYFCTEKCDGRLVLRLFFSVSVRITRVFFYLNACTFARINHHHGGEVISEMTSYISDKKILLSRSVHASCEQ